MNAVKLTPTRLAWLAHLAKFGETAWDRMPARSNGNGSVTNRTWAPLVDAGLIEARYYAPNFASRTDYYFKITDVGRVALAKLEG